MTKKIHFNMLMSNRPVRDRQDLQNHFNIDDALAWYKTGLLTRWLDVRGLEKDVQAVQALSGKDDQTLADALLRVFFPDMSQEDRHAATVHLAFVQERAETLARQSEHGFARDKVIADYHAGYKTILQSMLDNPEDYPSIKSGLEEIQMRYVQLFETDFRRFFEQFRDNCKLALFALLANSELRSMNLLTEDDLASVFNLVARLPEILPPYCTWSGQTDGYWKDIEEKGKKYILLRMESGNFVRNAGKNGEELSSEDVNGKFPIVDGIDYKSNYANDALVYLEV